MYKNKKPPGYRRLILKWGEKDSNLRRFPNGFTVRPRWPLEYLPHWKINRFTLFQYFGCKYSAVFLVSKQKLRLFPNYFLTD